MYLSDAVDAIRERLVRRRHPDGGLLWSMILQQIARQDSLDGRDADLVQEVVRSFVSRLDDGTVLSLWAQSETGMGDPTDPACLVADCVRANLEMELLQEVTELAWAEAPDGSA